MWSRAGRCSKSGTVTLGATAKPPARQWAKPVTLLTQHEQHSNRQIACRLTENSSGCPALRCVPVLLGAPLAVVMAPFGLLPDRMSFSRFSASCSSNFQSMSG